jgi:hypothetical protein
MHIELMAWEKLGSQEHGEIGDYVLLIEETGVLPGFWIWGGSKISERYTIRGDCTCWNKIPSCKSLPHNCLQDYDRIHQITDIWKAIKWGYHDDKKTYRLLEC